MIKQNKFNPPSGQTAQVKFTSSVACNNSQQIQRQVQNIPKQYQHQGSLNKRQQVVFASKTVSTQESPVLVWFKHDLRLADNCTLQAALETGQPVIPVFAFDPKHWKSLLQTAGGVNGLHTALISLSQRISARGSRLIIRYGDAAEQVADVAKQAGATTVFCEEEASHTWRKSVNELSSMPGMNVVPCSTTLYPPTTYTTLYKHYNPSEVRPLYPSDAVPGPESLPSAEPFQSIPSSDVYSVSDFTSALSAHVDAISHPSVATLASARTTPNPPSPALTLLDWEASGDSVVPCTEVGALSALDTYFNGIPKSPEDAPEPPPLPLMDSTDCKILRDSIYRVITETESKAGPGTSFTALFHVVMALGIVSRRQVNEVARGSSGDTWKAGLRKQVTGLGTEEGCVGVQVAMGGEFTTQMALQSIDEGVPLAEGIETKFWMWKGYQTEFYSVKATNPRPGAPAILLVHGFGAMGSQWRYNMKQLADQGFDVYAPTYLGYGRTEKPPLPYSQKLWTVHLRDFILNVVHKPVVVAGNSIGGYLAASVAGNYPSITRGAILFNAAGRIVEGYDPANDTETPAKANPVIAELSSRALFKYLQLTAKQTLKRVYTDKPENADSALANEIIRASRDPGAIGVFRSVFYLPKPRPLNFWLESFGGPVVVLQGGNDPLQDARSRATQISDVVEQSESVLLEAGHCPHDEVPEEVNELIVKFIEERVMVEEGGNGGAGGMVEEVEAEEKEVVHNVAS